MLHMNQRQRVYRFFSGLFANPGSELLEDLSGNEVEELAELLGVEAPAKSTYELSREDLAEVFTGLFVARMGGVPAPPYGSVYLDGGLLMGASTGQVAEKYSEQGLVFEDTTEPPDYLATELEFLYFLIGKEEAGFKQRDLAAAKKSTSSQCEFLEQCLLPWLEPFVERLAKTEEKTIYHWGAHALLGFCRQELNWLKRLT